jgi:hypothetical protein
MAGIQPIHESIPSDLLKPMLEEFRTGWELRKVQAHAQKKLIGQLNQQLHKHVDGLGQLSMRIPVDSYHYWGQRLGYACWKDKGFVKGFLRDNPECKVNSKAENTTLLVNGTKGLFDQFGRAI